MRKEETVDHHIKSAWHAISRMYNQQAGKHEITTAIGFVLLNIHSEHGTPATKIAPLLGLEARSLTRMLKTMEEKKLIYRAPDAIDKRSVRIFLTELGKRKKEVSRETVLTFNTRVQEVIPPEKLHVFFEVMADINQLAWSTPQPSNRKKVSPDITHNETIDP
jgi:MarR family transcriptional regulator, organic hydroperoxide resistance regulator